MAEITTERTFAGSLEQVFEAIRKYSEYPKYLPGVTGIEVLPATEKDSVCRVRYEVKVIKSITYTLHMYEERPRRIWWTLAESKLFKMNSGSWTLSPAGDSHTNAVYAIEVGLPPFVPSKIVDQLTKVNLPLTMDGFQKLIKDHEV